MLIPRQRFGVASVSLLGLLLWPGHAQAEPIVAGPSASVPDQPLETWLMTATPAALGDIDDTTFSTSAATLAWPDGSMATSLPPELTQSPATTFSQVAQAAGNSPSQWHFSFEPFVVLPLSTTGTLAVRDLSVNVNAGLSELLSPLNLALLGQFQGWYENQGFVVNATYFSAGEGASTSVNIPPLPFPLDLRGEASADLFRTDLLYAYRFTEEPESGYGDGFTEFDLPPITFDLMGGLRFTWLSQDVSVNSNVGFSRSLSNSDFILQPVIRGRLRWNTSDYLAVLLDTSVSALSFTGDSTFAVTATAGVEWLFSGNTSLSAGYQLNYIDYSGEGGRGRLDLLAHGPRLSFIFRF